jgi:hypothetical protein
LKREEVLKTQLDPPRIQLHASIAAFGAMLSGTKPEAANNVDAASSVANEQQRLPVQFEVSELPTACLLSCVEFTLGRLALT